MSQSENAGLKVISAGAVEYVVRGLARRFTADTGTRVDFTFRTIAGVRKLLAEGQSADLVVGTTSAIREMVADGTLLPGSTRDIGSTATGICVRAGAAVPDISTPQMLRDLLAAARSVAYSDPKVGGSSGIWLVRFMDGMGILSRVQAKSVLCKNGEDIVKAVADGTAEIGSTFVSEFPLAGGITSAGAIPASFGNATSYAAGLRQGSANVEAARKFLAFITSDREAWSSCGFEPA